ncbi:hypothetical protein [Novosphingobium sp. NBM11]|uniref:hypothetical protein n=1 Tax=Novosphingobium sp. NBM11 TaxID=2596914 RepID=UPI0018922CAC|nr:hypothetical protein [Novosphingobium sp. NBM11]
MTPAFPGSGLAPSGARPVTARQLENVSEQGTVTLRSIDNCLAAGLFSRLAHATVA